MAAPVIEAHFVGHRMARGQPVIRLANPPKAPGVEALLN
jgi:hypothetical protein